MLFRKTVCIFALALLISNPIFANSENIQDIKQQAIALYTTGNFNEAFKLIKSLGLALPLLIRVESLCIS